MTTDEQIFGSAFAALLADLQVWSKRSLLCNVAVADKSIAIIRTKEARKKWLYTRPEWLKTEAIRSYCSWSLELVAIELHASTEMQKSASKKFPVKYRAAEWWWSEFWIARMINVRELLRKVRAVWKIDAYKPSYTKMLWHKRRRKQWDKDKRDAKARQLRRERAYQKYLNNDDFGLRSIWREIFLPAMRLYGQPRPFVAEQIQYYGDPRHAGAW